MSESDGVASKVSEDKKPATEEEKSKTTSQPEQLPSSCQATISAPEVPDTVHLTVSSSAASPGVVVVATAAVDAVEPASVTLTAVAAEQVPVRGGTGGGKEGTVPAAGGRGGGQGGGGTAVSAAPVKVTEEKTASQQQPQQLPSQQQQQQQQPPQQQPLQQQQQPPQQQQPSVGPSAPSANPTVKSFESQPDDFYRTIFYFSGMGHVIGSALAEGVYVDEKNRRSAIDPDEANAFRTASTGQRAGRGEHLGLITTARNQANGLSAEFRRLQTLLEGLPTFTDAGDASRSSTGAGVRIDEPIHGDIYFRSERPAQHQQQQQQLASQRVRQQNSYIIEPAPVSIYQQLNGHAFDQPWSYFNSF